MIRCPLVIALMTLAALVTGCASRHQPAIQTVVEAGRYDGAMAAAAEVLRDRGFVIDRHDRRYGVVTTEPLGAATFLEPWKPNNVTADEALVNTFNDQRRTVTVSLSPVTEPDADQTASDRGAVASGPYAMSVEVQVERRQTVTRRAGGAPGSQVFSYLAAAPVELRRRGIDSEYWRPVGRDPALERRLAEQITARLDGR